MDVFQSWLSGTQEPNDIATAVQSIFQKIESLPETQRNQVYSQLRSDNQITQAVSRLQPANT